MTVEFITALFYEVDEQLRTLPKHPEARLWPSEVVTLGLLHALKGGGNRAFYRWLTRDYRPLFPASPSARGSFVCSRPIRTGRGRYLGCSDRAWGHRHVWDRVDPSDAGRAQPAADWPQRPLEPPLDCRRETLSAAQPVGVDRGVGVCHRQYCRQHLQWLIQQVDGRMIVLSDTGFHAAEGNPATSNCVSAASGKTGCWWRRSLSMLTLVCHLKKVMHRGWVYFQARLAFTMAAFNVLVQWHGFQPNASGFVPLSMADFSL